MPRRISSGLLLWLAALTMTIALACQNVTLANGDYRGVLFLALLGMCTSDLCCCIVIARSGRMRWVAVVLAIVFTMSSLFIVSDFLRRAPVAWGRG